MIAEAGVIYLNTTMQPTSNPSNTTVVANDCSDIPPPYAQADIPPVYVRGNQSTATPEAQQQQQRPASAQPDPPNNTNTSSPTTTTNNTTAAIPQNSTRIVASAYARISTRLPSARALENARLEESIRRRNYTWTMAYLISGLFIVVTFPVAVWYLSHLRF